MGFAEVLLNLNTIFKNIKFCKTDIATFDPDVIIFIDYSGFNLRIAQWAKARGFKTNYYISPQIWASREQRIQKIRSSIDAMYVILPFEKAYYEEKHHIGVHFVGHPLFDAMQNRPVVNEGQFRQRNQLHVTKPIIALLPGSREQEVIKMLWLMLSVVNDFKEYQFVIAGAPSLTPAFYVPYLGRPNVAFVTNQTYDLLAISRAALVTSGTATLETALFKVPQVVCYRANWISYQIAKRIITLDYISLVNLIMGKEVVKELIQGDLNTINLKTELSKVLADPGRAEQLKDYVALEKMLGGPGASEKTAALIIQGLTVE